MQAIAILMFQCYWHHQDLYGQLYSTHAQRHRASLSLAFGRLARLGVDLGAGDPYLALGPCLGGDVPHVHHGRREGAAEGGRAGCEAPDGGVGAAAAEQLLVGLQQPLLRQQVAEVGVVEGGG